MKRPLFSLPVPFALAPPMVIDAGTAVVRAAEHDPRTGAVRTLVIPRETADVGFDVDEVGRLVRMLERSGFASDSAVVIAPKSIVSVLPIDLPPAESGAPIEQIARSRAADMLGTERHTFELSISSSPLADEARRSSTVAVCSHEDGAGLIDAFHAAGLRVARLISPAQAMIDAAVGVSEPDDGDARLVVDVGWADTTAVAIRGGKPLFERHLKKIGYRRVAEELAPTLSDAWLARWMLCEGRTRVQAPADRVASVVRPFGIDVLRELDATLTYLDQIVGASDIKEVLLTGGGSTDDELLDWLTANLWKPVRPLAELIPAAQPGTSRVPACLAVATAIASNSLASRGVAA
ncbi:MAG: hypothetical protein AAGI17_06210 [Planctomycetota bacterium]